MRFYTHFSKPEARYIRIFCRQELIPLIALVGSKIFYRALQRQVRRWVEKQKHYRPTDGLTDLGTKERILKVKISILAFW